MDLLPAPELRRGMIRPAEGCTESTLEGRKIEKDSTFSKPSEETAGRRSGYVSPSSFVRQTPSRLAIVLTITRAAPGTPKRGNGRRKGRTKEDESHSKRCDVYAGYAARLGSKGGEKAVRKNRSGVGASGSLKIINGETLPRSDIPGPKNDGGHPIARGARDAGANAGTGFVERGKR